MRISLFLILLVFSTVSSAKTCGDKSYDPHTQTCFNIYSNLPVLKNVKVAFHETTLDRRTMAPFAHLTKTTFWQQAESNSFVEDAYHLEGYHIRFLSDPLGEGRQCDWRNVPDEMLMGKYVGMTILQDSKDCYLDVVKRPLTREMLQNPNVCGLNQEDTPDPAKTFCLSINNNQSNYHYAIETYISEVILGHFPFFYSLKTWSWVADNEDLDRPDYSDASTMQILSIDGISVKNCLFDSHRLFTPENAGKMISIDLEYDGIAFACNTRVTD